MIITICFGRPLDDATVMCLICQFITPDIRYDFQLRLPENVNEDIQEDPTALRSLWDRGVLNGASQKVDQVAVFYTGDLVTSLQKTSLVPGANECVIYTTIGGAIGILVPFISKDVS
ncbi:hypothetical protein Q1695_009967 [Nippostrongylus brasiliensis]|nr:hypothetical protein Q1695_009967 [Nippostrongylus brasiliensis]